MTTQREVERTTAVTVRGSLLTEALYALVQREVPDAPPDATIELYVSIPGGGDWSNTDLELDLKTVVRFKVEWSEHS